MKKLFITKMGGIGYLGTMFINFEAFGQIGLNQHSQFFLKSHTHVCQNKQKGIPRYSNQNLQINHIASEVNPPEVFNCE